MAMPEEMHLDLAAWSVFVALNSDDIVAEYGSVDAALKLAENGGLEMGGGASPLVIVYVGSGEAL